jgi:hypothetical protein
MIPPPPLSKKGRRFALARYGACSRLKGRVSLVHYELINPKVQLVGNAAVLTFNYLSRDASGAEERWNCTEVYRHDGRQWQIIQTHWSRTKGGG